MICTVPVILIFTKFDALDVVSYQALKNEGYPPGEAAARASVHALENFEKSCSSLPVFSSQYPPKAFVILRGK